MQISKGLLGIIVVTFAMLSVSRGQSPITNADGSYWQPCGFLQTYGWSDVGISGDGSKILAVQGANDFFYSTNYGTNWVDTGYGAYGRKVGLSYDGSKLLAPSHFGYINVSQNGGNSWLLQNGVQPWQCAAVSADGTTMAVGTYYGGQMYISRDSGSTFNAYGGGGYWYSVSASQNGQYLIAGMTSGQVQVSTNYGVNWQFVGPSGLCAATAISYDGSRMYAGISFSNVFVSTNYGVTWSPTSLTSTNQWPSMCCSSDGTVVFAVDSPGGYIHRSTDGGQTWTIEDTNRNWQSITIASNASKAVAGVSGGDIYTWNLSAPLTSSYLTNGLVAYYPFSGNANDASGNGNNGTILDGSFISDRFGNTSNAFEIPNSNASWNWGLDTGIGDGLSTNLTLALWFKVPSGGGGILITHGVPGYVDPYISVTKGQLTFRVSAPQNWLDYHDSSITEDQWHSVVATISGTSDCLYFDGKLVLAGSNPTPSSSGTWKLGPMAAGYDNVRIYNRALSSNDVSALYTSESIIITNQPVSSTNNIGDTVNFTVGASTVNPVSFQWIKDGITLNGQTNATIAITNVRPVNVGAYSVVISDAFGNSITSSNAILTLNGVNTGIWEGLVAFYPFNGNANDATGNGNDGVLNGGGFGTDRLGFTNSSLVLDSSLGQYVSVSNNMALNITNDITISAWVYLPVLTSYRTAYTIVSKRKNADFNNFPYDFGVSLQFGIQTDFDVAWFVTAQNGAYQYLEASDQYLVPTNQWVQLVSVVSNNMLTLYMNNTVIGTNSINPNSRFANTANLLIGSGARTDIPAEFFNGQMDDLRIYNRALSSNDVAALYSLESNPPIPPFITNQPVDVPVLAFSNATFNVGASGYMPMSFQWQFNTTNILNATNSILNITNTKQSNVGQYQVVITNAYGSVTSTVANLNMYPFLNAPFKGVVAYWGQPNTLSVGAWGSGTLSYQWFFNGQPLPGATNSTLPLGAIQFTNAGQYSVVVSNNLGSVTNAPYSVVVNPAEVSLAITPTVVIQGTVGYTYAIQSTTDLGDTNSWMVETNIVLTQPTQKWHDDNVDTSKGVNPKKFYRVIAGQ